MPLNAHSPDGALPAPVVMYDHPGWITTEAGHRRVLADDEHRVFTVRTDAHSITWHSHPNEGALAIAQVEWPPTAAAEVPELARTLADLGCITRVTNPSLWDAVATAIIRQVVRASQATAMYRRFATAHGHAVDLGNRTGHLLPTPKVVADLDDADFDRTGMAFKRDALRAAAAAFLDNQTRWPHLPPETLVQELQQVPRIGPWTAGAAVADWSNDFTVYPHGDLAVRTWAAKAAPSTPWPAGEAAFARHWRRVAAGHLSEMTLFTLTWGSHHAATVRPHPWS